MKKSHLLFTICCGSVILCFAGFFIVSIFNHGSDSGNSDAVDVEVNGDNFILGENILITLRNNLNEDIYILGNCSPFVIEKYENGTWKEKYITHNDHIYLKNFYGYFSPLICFNETNTVRYILRKGDSVTFELETWYGAFSFKPGLYRVKVYAGKKCRIDKIPRNVLVLSVDLGYDKNNAQKNYTVDQLIAKCNYTAIYTSDPFEIIG